MKPFLEVITEQSPNDKLDKLTHNIPLSTKRLKQLNNFSDLALMFDFEGWQGYPPPSNSSKVAFDEIQYLIGLQEFRDQWETDMRMHDTKVIKAFRKYVDKHNLEVDLDEIKRISDQADSIILSLKRFYNRPRPKVLANKLGLGFSFFPLKTAETPSYPSGHATHGRLVAKLVADEVPFEHRRNIIRMGEDIGEGRMIAGAHYPTDTNFGHLLGDELYRLAKSSSSELKLETLGEMTQTALQQKIADLDPGLDVHSTTKRIANTGDMSNKDFEKILKDKLDAKNVKLINPRTGKNKSAVFDMFEFEIEGDDKVYDITLAGKVAGRSSQGTSDNETSFLLVLAARQAGAKDDIEDIAIKMIDPNVYGKVSNGKGIIGEEQAKKLLAYVENNESWFTSHRLQVNALLKAIGKNIPKLYVKDDSSLDVNTQAVDLYKQDFGLSIARSLDKWNPADVWLYYDRKVPDHSNLTALNMYLYYSIKSAQGVIGISLKKGSGILGYKNYHEPDKIHLKKVDLKMSALGSLSGTLAFVGDGVDGMSLGFRIFDAKDTGLIRGEGEKEGAEAVQGKVALELLDTFTGKRWKNDITSAGGADILELKKGKWSFTTNGKKKFKTAKANWTFISRRTNLTFARGASKMNHSNAFRSENTFLKWLDKQDKKENAGKAWVNSKFQVLELFSKLHSMSQIEEKKLAFALLKYAKSESEWSAAHLKLE